MPPTAHRSQPAVAATVFALVASWAMAGVRDRFLFELDGVPVGTVELAVDGGEYRYTSNHFFARGDGHQRRMRSASFRLLEGGRDAATGDVLESWWLWTNPTPGCRQVRAELGRRRSLACVQQRDDQHASGTLGEEPFRAEYERGRLRVLSMGSARFSRIDGEAAPLTPPRLFEEGWPIEGERGALRIEGVPRSASPESNDVLRTWKSASSARSLAREMRRRLQRDLAATCVDHVQAFAEASSGRDLGSVLIVHGLVAERGGDRAFPHVWVRVPVAGSWLELDPSLGVEITPETHVALVAVRAGDATGAAGRAWLEFTSSAVRIVRSSP